MTFPSLRDWIFSLKSFAGAMLALWLAMYLNLDRPYWAMATAYIVAQPLTGAMRSKAAYRFVGTFIGAVVTIILVPNLVDAPVLLVAALSLWVALCIYFALLDRSPRSYLFLLAGYTVALIGFPAVDTPGAIWDIVLARVEEISLGIGCTTLIGTLILPQPLGPALAGRIDELLRQADAASLALLSGAPDDAASRAARRRMAGEAVEIATLSTHLAFDTSHYQAASASVSLIYQRVILLLAVLSGAADRIEALRRSGGLTEELQSLLARVASWLRERDAIADDAPALHAHIAALETSAGTPSDWNSVMRGGLLSRLHELADICHDISALRHQLVEGRARLPTLTVHTPMRPPRHRDHVMAAYSGAAAVLTVGLISAYWIAAAWPEGSGAASLAAVACSFFAAQDDPVPSLVKFTYGVLAAVVLDAIYLFAILPPAHDFEMLALALAPLYLLVGVLMAQPRLAPIAGPVAFISATLMSLSASYAADFAAYANGAVASVIGLAGAAVVLRLVRSVGAGWTARRLLSANRADIADAASHAATADRLVFAALMLDRLAELVPRMAATAEGADRSAREALGDIRVGINVVDLQNVVAIPGHPAAAAEIHEVLSGISAHYRSPIGTDAGSGLLARIDSAIAACCIADTSFGRPALLALGGVRRALFRDAPPYVPPVLPPPALEMAA